MQEEEPLGGANQTAHRKHVFEWKGQSASKLIDDIVAWVSVINVHNTAYTDMVDERISVCVLQRAPPAEISGQAGMSEYGNSALRNSQTALVPRTGCTHADRGRLLRRAAKPAATEVAAASRPEGRQGQVGRRQRRRGEHGRCQVRRQ